MYCIGWWAEENTEYIGINEEAEYYWTPFLEQALLVKKPIKGKEPQNCFWLPVFVPDRIVSSWLTDCFLERALLSCGL